MNDYLRNCNLRTETGMSYGIWEEILSGVPQDSILGPFLFVIFLCELFLEHDSRYFTN